MTSAVPGFLFALLFFILLPTSLVAQNNTVRVGDSLTAGDPQARPWISPSGDFAFGFQKLETEDLYLLSIWYNKIEDQTIVWYAYMEGDPAVPPNSKVTLTSDRGLLLNGPQGNQIWRSGITVSEADSGFLNNTGNFIVSDRNGQKLWESFAHPTDTLLPTQVMEVNSTLSSTLTRTNFSSGRYQFRFQEDGNAVLYTVNLPTEITYKAYFSTETADATNTLNIGKQVMFNESGYLYVRKANNETILLTPETAVLTEDNYYRATLLFDGVFVIYSHPKTSTGNWSIIRSMPENICTSILADLGSGPCGFNGICILSIENRPLCKCPPRFSLVDSLDAYGGCKPDFPIQACDVSISPENYTFQELINTDWPLADFEKYENFDAGRCQEACRLDCLCTVAISRAGNCWKKKLPLANGREDVSVRGTAYIKMPKNDLIAPIIPFPPEKKNNNETLILIVSVLLGCSLLANFILAGGISFAFLSFYRNRLAVQNQSLRTVESNVRSFSYKELEEATNGFKEELGRGSFGIVYKGLLEISSRTAVAVKKLDRVIRESEKEFKTEVDVIAQTHHKNLVRLIGYCDEEQHRLLVYEFVSNGTLAQFLFGDIKLSWEQRIQIAVGVAKGLQYLHEECSTQVIHCDIKPQNILLDDFYNAKIADFGLAKLLMRDKSNTLTAIRGTKGYVAAEWYRNLPITTKVDVYSFGVMLLEIVCCRRNANMEMEDERAILTDWANDCYAEGTIEALVANDEEVLADKKTLERFVKVAIWCVQEDPNLRPTMKQVMLMLEGVIQVPDPPCPCPLSISD